MPTINQLSSITTVSGSDLIPVYSQSNGDSRKISVTNLLAYFRSNLTAPEFSTQYASPSATAFTIAVNDSSDNTFLVLAPLAVYADGAITLPAVANCIDGQEVLVCSSQVVTAFVVNGNGAVDVIGSPTALTAGGFFRLRFDATYSIWHRVG